MNSSSVGSFKNWGRSRASKGYKKQDFGPRKETVWPERRPGIGVAAENRDRPNRIDNVPQMDLSPATSERLLS